jgi:2-oxoglutarate ferredoxin oxidoreductase subunit delta
MSSTKAKEKKAEAYIVILEERCKSCRFCVETCPNKCIAIGTTINSQGYNPARFEGDGRCTGCCLCAEVCPDTAIEVYKR